MKYQTDDITRSGHSYGCLAEGMCRTCPICGPLHMTETITVDGATFTIERTDNPKLPYILRGPRNTAYVLVRNYYTPHILIVHLLNRMGLGKVRGYERFTDKNGTLEPMR